MQIYAQALLKHKNRVGQRWDIDKKNYNLSKTSKITKS